LATFLIDMSPADMQRRLHEALGVYVDAMRYPRGTEAQRASMWLEHTRRHGWKAVAAVETAAKGRAAVETAAKGRAAVETAAKGRAAVETAAETATAPPTAAELDAGRLLGVAYGYCGSPDQWWQQQVVQGLHRIGRPRTEISQLMNNYFELTELHISPDAQGRGLGEALLRRLLHGRPEAHVLLSTPEIVGEANRAWRLYRRLGFYDIIRGYHFSGDPRAFAILGRTLPLLPT
jgi:ribosomal protein S18 acetylase RimI-like enzyme